MDDPKFTVRTKNGLEVRTTHNYWNKIITFKHPAMRGMETHVMRTLENPDEIRVSKGDNKVLLYYGKYGKYFICVVVKKLNGKGFYSNYVSDRENKRGFSDMAQVKIYYDSAGKTLTVWFDDPTKEEVSEEIGNEIVLIKDKTGKTIGFERLNFDMKKERETFSIEAVAV